MLTFEKLYSEGHEEVVFFSDASCGLKAIVAIHNTILGPALGGTRLWPYADINEAITDVLRLSKGMTYKAAVSGLNLGGGKAVIIADPNDKSEALFRAYGRFLESLNGRYITAEDVNIGVEDIEHIFTETNNVCGVAKTHGGSGNPSPYTARGVFRGIEASLTKVYGDRSVKNKVVALQGAGSVGRNLGELLYKNGAKVLFTDINEKNIQAFKDAVPNAEFIASNDIYDVNCDVYAPCALGATINDKTIDRLKCKIVAGAANNQLDETRHGEILKDKGILYAPDYLINAGGLMNVSIEFEGWSDSKATRMVDTIYDTTLKIFQISDEQDVPVHKATDMLAEARIESIRKIKGSYLGNIPHRFPGRKKRH
ncbi:MAG: leucine dehydrogenase [Bdellovibrionales bacterium CG12_big_fil_rev_8_21_14_0_65_38_15]|nr:MAG: leucine dehydrogenase [Bdellovibrionales bacterium CG22_combo_CG10-13_8_21_14_all_38_13]PIQ55831.1 MAG: leucine dehydrogenase [Bdellovibrionales bacterium CG12_big_fil_rev_8_21_14_0_65_38_15]PIR28734.1 MAG: leucine dehydrogenase [Bdellovibrionales bacterium CG11_big_fil_rev_8_21_14_0_20_38_13]